MMCFAHTSYAQRPPVAAVSTAALGAELIKKIPVVGTVLDAAELDPNIMILLLCDDASCKLDSIPLNLR